MNQTPDSRPAQAAGAGPDAHALWQEAKNVVSNVADQASEKLKLEVDARKEKAAEKVGEVATALRDTSGKLRDAGPIPDLADQAAQQIERIATYVQTRNLGDLVREAERFARREPAIFLGASFVVGLLGGRLMKASSHREAKPLPDRRAERERGQDWHDRQLDRWAPGAPQPSDDTTTLGQTQRPAKMPEPMRTAVEEQAPHQRSSLGADLVTGEERTTTAQEPLGAAQVHPVAKAAKPAPTQPDKRLERQRTHTEQTEQTPRPARPDVKKNDDATE